MNAQTPRCTTLRVVCAWCPGFVRGAETEPTSHGICPTCFARVSAEIDADYGDDDDDDEPEADDDDREADRCEECERSHGPHYRGPCEHGRSGIPIDFHD